MPEAAEAVQVREQAEGLTPQAAEAVQVAEPAEGAMPEAAEAVQVREQAHGVKPQAAEAVQVAEPAEGAMPEAAEAVQADAASAPAGGGEEEIAEEELEVDPEDDHVQAERLLNQRWVAEDQCRWTIFEDMEDELSYHRRRSRALCCFVRAYASLREEYDRLQEGGLGLQDAYEQLQDELREAVGDAAYWRELAEARGEGCAEPLKAHGSEAGASHNKVATPPAPSEEVELPCVEDIEKQQVEPGSRQALRLEMLKDAQTQVLRWRRLAEQRGEECGMHF
jgi:hypothetical protein